MVDFRILRTPESQTNYLTFRGVLRTIESLSVLYPNGGVIPGRLSQRMHVATHIFRGYFFIDVSRGLADARKSGTTIFFEILRTDER
jgi:hypothetical protein